MRIEDAKYIAWVGYAEGSVPHGYDTLKEAILHETYGTPKYITGPLIQWEPQPHHESK